MQCGARRNTHHKRTRMGGDPEAFFQSNATVDDATFLEISIFSLIAYSFDLDGWKHVELNLSQIFEENEISNRRGEILVFLLPDQLREELSLLHRVYRTLHAAKFTFKAEWGELSGPLQSSKISSEYSQDLHGLWCLYVPGPEKFYQSIICDHYCYTLCMFVNFVPCLLNNGKPEGSHENCVNNVLAVFIFLVFCREQS